MNGFNQLIPTGELRRRDARAGCEGVVQRIHDRFISKLADLCIADKSANFDIVSDGKLRGIELADEFPFTSSGRISRRTLRARAAGTPRCRSGSPGPSRACRITWPGRGRRYRPEPIGGLGRPHSSRSREVRSRPRSPAHMARPQAVAGETARSRSAGSDEPRSSRSWPASIEKQGAGGRRTGTTGITAPGSPRVAERRSIPCHRLTLGARARHGDMVEHVR